MRIVVISFSAASGFMYGRINMLMTLKPEPQITLFNSHISHSLNSLKAVIWGVI